MGRKTGRKMDKKNSIEDAGYCFKTVKLFINTTEKLALCNCREKEGVKGGSREHPKGRLRSS